MREPGGEAIPLHSLHSQVAQQFKLLPQQPNGQFSKPKSQQLTQVLRQFCSPLKLTRYPWKALVVHSSSSSSSPCQPLSLGGYKHDVAFPSSRARGKNLTQLHRVNIKSLGLWWSYKRPGEDDKTRVRQLRDENDKNPRVSDSSSPISEVSLKMWQMLISCRHGRVTRRSHPAHLHGSEWNTNSKQQFLLANLKDIAKITSFVQCRMLCSMREKNCQKLNRQMRVKSPLHGHGISVIVM